MLPWGGEGESNKGTLNSKQEGRAEGQRRGLFTYTYIRQRPLPKAKVKVKVKAGWLAIEPRNAQGINQSMIHQTLTFHASAPPLPPPPPKSPRQASIYIYASTHLDICSRGGVGAFPAALRFYATPTGEKKNKRASTKKKKGGFYSDQKGGFFFSACLLGYLKKLRYCTGTGIPPLGNGGQGMCVCCRLLFDLERAV